MKTFLLKLSSPNGDLFCQEVVKLSVRGTEGELGVLAGHIPFVTCVKPCRCRIELPDGVEKAGEITGGYLNVSGEQVTLLTGGITWE